MGRAKQQMIEDDERGVSSTSTAGFFVCRNCFGNPGLKHWVTENQVEGEHCSFCGPMQRSSIVAELDGICEYIVECLSERFNDPVEELPYESREGGYQGVVLDKWEILDEAGLDRPNDDSGKLLDAITSSMLQDNWCQRDYFGLSEDLALKFSWEEYVEVAKSGSVLEFMYGKNPGDLESMPPSELLDWITEKVEEFGLVRKIELLKKYFRVRRQNVGESHTTYESFGPPPVSIALRPNRLNPAHTQMLYLAENADTALKETVQGAGAYAIAELELTSSMYLLDLVDLPTEICFFDLENSHLREVIQFLKAFAAEVSKPLIVDDDRDIEYRPTQIITQHFRRRLTTENGHPIHGIRYTSAQGPGVCVGLFGENIRVTDHSPKDHPVNLANYNIGYIKFVSATIQTCI